jgi:hypothetical protein
MCENRDFVDGDIGELMEMIPYSLVGVSHLSQVSVATVFEVERFLCGMAKEK